MFAAGPVEIFGGSGPFEPMTGMRQERRYEILLSALTAFLIQARKASSGG